MSEKAAALEKAGNARDLNFIHRRTDEMLQQYREYLTVLEPFCTDKEETEDKDEISEAALRDFFSEMRVALEDLDMDKMEEVIQDMNQYSYAGWKGELFEQLKTAVEEVEVDNCEAILQTWENKL